MNIDKTHKKNLYNSEERKIMKWEVNNIFVHLSLDADVSAAIWQKKVVQLHVSSNITKILADIMD